MPDKSQKQHNLMEAAKHSAKVRQKTGISIVTADKYLKADKKLGRFQRSNPLIPKKTK